MTQPNNFLLRFMSMWIPKVSQATPIARFSRNQRPGMAIFVAFASVGLSGTVPSFRFSRLPNGIGEAAMFGTPTAVAADSNGNLFVADLDHVIRRISTAKVVTTFAGKTGVGGTNNGHGSDARFWGVNEMGIDAANNLYILDARPVRDTYTAAVRRISPDGDVSTVADAGVQWGTGAANDPGYWWDAYSMAVDALGNVYLHDTKRNCISKVSSDGRVTTLYTASPGLQTVGGMGIDPEGNVYIANWNAELARISPAGEWTTILQNTGAYHGENGIVQLTQLDGIAVDAVGVAYVTDHEYGGVFRVSPDGAVTVVAGGQGNTYASDGTGKNAGFAVTEGICLDKTGNIYVTDRTSIRRISATRDVSVYAGVAQYSGSADGIGGAYGLFTPHATVINASGDVFVADYYDYAIRRISHDGLVSTLAGHVGSPGLIDGAGDAARFADLAAMTIGTDGTLYIAEYSCVRTITPSGVVRTIAGNPNEIGAANGGADVARFYDLRGIAVDSAGTVYVADHGNTCIRSISRDRLVSTYAGELHQRVFVDGPWNTARFFSPDALSIGPDGSLYVQDLCTIRHIDRNRNVQTLAGKPGAYNTTDGPGESALLSTVNGIAVDWRGDVFFSQNGCLRVMTPDRIVITMGGAFPGAPTAEFATDQMHKSYYASEAFQSPQGIAIDWAGRLLVADAGDNQCIWMGVPQEPPAKLSSRLVNISTLSFAGTGVDAQIAGFVIQGSQPKRVLIRASGPALAQFGLEGTLSDPSITLFDSNQSILATNNDWDDSAVESVASSCGAFPWSKGSKDAAVVVVLNPGTYSAVVTGQDGGVGMSLIEVYEVDANSGDNKLTNISTRSRLISGAGLQTAGFVVSGTEPKKVLIRASGPSLKAFGVGDALSDPVLTLLDSTGSIVADNDDWNADSIESAANSAGAFQWIAGTKDAALVATLSPGNYTAQVKGKNGATGATLIEVYALP